MYGLLYKDFIVHKKMLIPMFCAAIFIQILQFPTLLGDPEEEAIEAVSRMMNFMSTSLGFLMIGNLQNHIYENDEKKKFAYYITASETGIKSHVQEKYLFTYLISTIGVIAFSLMNALAIDFGGNAESSVIICLILFYVQIFLRSIEIPFIMAFSSKKGNDVKAVMILILMMAGMIYLLFGDLSIFGDSMDNFWERLFDFLDSEKSPEVRLLMALSGVGSLLCYYISYRISCKVYLKGVDSYAK